MTEPREGKRLASVKEALEYARMGRTKLYEKLNAGTITAYKDGKRTLIDLDSVDAGLAPWRPGDEE